MPPFDLPKCVMPAINFKGGTGKTTVAIAIAEGICHTLGKRVLLIDCDFQCSLSIALLGRNALNNLIEAGATLDCQLQRQMLCKDSSPLIDAVVEARYCVKEASELLFVVPGNPDMPRREREILSSFWTETDIHSAYQRASTYIAQLYRSLLDEFELVLIDCPPGLTLFSEAAIRAADGLIVPTLPNEISFAAIDHLRREIARTRPDRTLEDLLVGTVISKLSERPGGAHHRYQARSIEKLLDRVAPGFRVLKPYLPYCKELEATTWREEDSRRADFARRYGQSSAMIEQLARALVDRCGTVMAGSSSKAKATQASNAKCLTP
jgi:chromosome partitioning protein